MSEGVLEDLGAAEALMIANIMVTYSKVVLKVMDLKVMSLIISAFTSAPSLNLPCINQRN